MTDMVLTNLFLLQPKVALMNQNEANILRPKTFIVHTLLELNSMWSFDLSQAWKSETLVKSIKIFP